jgi:hypothetical protein
MLPKPPAIVPPDLSTHFNVQPGTVNPLMTHAMVASGPATKPAPLEALLAACWFALPLGCRSRSIRLFIAYALRSQ